MSEVNYQTLTEEHMQYFDSEEFMLGRMESELDSMGFPTEQLNKDCLLQILRDHELDVDEAVCAFMSTQQLGQKVSEQDVSRDFVLEEEDAVDKYYPMYHHKRDKHGRPIIIHDFKRLIYDELLSITTTERLIKRFIHLQERLVNELLPNAEHDAGHPIDGACVLVRMNEMTDREVSKLKRTGYINEVISIALQRYPGSVSKLYFIDYPFDCTVCDPYLEKTLDGLMVYAPGVVWFDEVQSGANFDRASLPTSLHGVCDCKGSCRN